MNYSNKEYLAHLSTDLLNTGLFCPALFSPLYIYIFSPSDIGPDTIVMKERRI